MTVALPHTLDLPNPTAPLDRLRKATRRLRASTGHLRDVSARMHTACLPDLPYPAAVLAPNGSVEAVNDLFAAAYPVAEPGVAWTVIVGTHDQAAFSRALVRAATRRTVVTVLDAGTARVWTLTAAHDGRIAISA